MAVEHGYQPSIHRHYLTVFFPSGQMTFVSFKTNVRSGVDNCTVTSFAGGLQDHESGAGHHQYFYLLWAMPALTSDGAQYTNQGRPDQRC
jgi:hypothetical protein